jgi:hypothetical protein
MLQIIRGEFLTIGEKLALGKKEGYNEHCVIGLQSKKALGNLQFYYMLIKRYRNIQYG